MNNHRYEEMPRDALPRIALTDDVHSLPGYLWVDRGGEGDDLALLFAHQEAFAEWFMRVERCARDQRLIP